MGLLDDAIREHLELKRLRAAEEPEATPYEGATLDPLPGDDPVVPDRDAAHDGLPPELWDETAPERAATSNAPSTTEETAELDIQAELGRDLGASADPAPRPDRVAPLPGAVDQERADAP